MSDHSIDAIILIVAALILGTAFGITHHAVSSSGRASMRRESMPLPSHLLSKAEMHALPGRAVSDPFTVLLAAEADQPDAVVNEPAPIADLLESLSLTGTAGGPPWSAVVSAADRETMRVLRVGDTIANTRVMAIYPDSIVLKGEFGVRALHLKGRTP